MGEYNTSSVNTDHKAFDTGQQTRDREEGTGQNMALYEILKEPNPVLHTLAAPVETIDASIRTLLDDMLETMYGAGGIGLAAPQIGILKRLVVVDLGEDGPSQNNSLRFPLKMVNPEIVWQSKDDQSFSEGCLSVPDHYVDVVRPARIRVSFRDAYGVPKTLEAGGLLAICLQHEVDHLNGVTLLTHESQSLNSLGREDVKVPLEKLVLAETRAPSVRAR